MRHPGTAPDRRPQSPRIGGSRGPSRPWEQLQVDEVVEDVGDDIDAEVARSLRHRTRADERLRACAEAPSYPCAREDRHTTRPGPAPHTLPARTCCRHAAGLGRDLD